MEVTSDIPLALLSVTELRQLKRAQFASLSVDELECLLARMGVAISLQERNNKEYYLDKVMELIAELVYNKSQSLSHFSTSFQPAQQPPPTLFPRASAFPPAHLSPFSTSFTPFYSHPSSDVNPSAPPLLMLPPFSTPCDVVSPHSMYKYDTSHTTIRRLSSSEPATRSVDEARKRGGVGIKARYDDLLLEKKEESRLTVLFPRPKRKIHRSTDWGNGGGILVVDCVRNLCVKAFCIIACLAPILIALSIFFLLSANPLPLPDHTVLLRTENIRWFDDAEKPTEHFEFPDADKEPEKQESFSFFQTRHKNGERDGMQDHFCQDFAIDKRIKLILSKRAEQLIECGGDNRNKQQIQVEEEDLEEELYDPNLRRIRSNRLLSEEEIREQIKTQLRKEKKPFETITLGDGRDIFDLCFGRAFESIALSLSSNQLHQVKLIQWKPGLGYDSNSGRLFVFSPKRSSSFIPCYIRTFLDHPFVYISIALLPIVLCIGWMIQCRQKMYIEKRGVEWIAKKVREKLIEHCKYEKMKRDMYSQDVREGFPTVNSKSSLGYPVEHIRDYACSIWRFHHPSYTYLFDSIWARVEDLNLNDTRIKETERVQGGQIVRYWKWDAAIMLEDTGTYHL